MFSMLMLFALAADLPSPASNLGTQLTRQFQQQHHSKRGVCVYRVLEKDPRGWSILSACGVFTGSKSIQQGEVVPYRVEFGAQNQVVRLQHPADGSLYQRDLKRLFSEAARNKITPQNRDQLLKELYEQASETLK